MGIEIHIHTEDLDIFKNEKKDYSGAIHIPDTKATFSHFGLTQDIGCAGGTEYILNCVVHGELSEIAKMVDWIYSKIKDKAKKITIGDLKGKCEWLDIDKGKMANVLKKLMNQK